MDSLQATLIPSSLMDDMFPVVLLPLLPSTSSWSTTHSGCLLQAGEDTISISNPAYCHSDQIWIRSIQGARHHLEAQSFFYRPHSPLSELISLALYDWEHLNALQRDPAEANLCA